MKLFDLLQPQNPAKPTTNIPIQPRLRGSPSAFLRKLKNKNTKLAALLSSGSTPVSKKDPFFIQSSQSPEPRLVLDNQPSRMQSSGQGSVIM
jgi:hypothetical protein